MPRYGYWAPSPAAIKQREMQELGYGGRDKYKSASDFYANMLKPPYPIPRRGTVTHDDIQAIEAVISHDLGPRGLKFRVRGHDTDFNRLVEVDVEHFVLMRFKRSGLSHLKYYITKKLNDKDRDSFKDRCKPLFELAMKAKDIENVPEPEPGSVLQQWRGAPKPPKKTKATKDTPKVVDENDPWRNKLPQYEPYVKRPDDDDDDDEEEGDENEELEELEELEDEDEEDELDEEF